MVHSLDHLGYFLKNKAVLSPIVSQLIKKKKEKKSRYGCAVVFHLSFQYCLQLSNLLCSPCATISIKCESAQKL